MYLKGKRAYLGGAIEHGDPGHNWRTEPVRILQEEFGIDLFDPFADPKQQWVPALNKARDEDDEDTMERIAKNFVRKDMEMVDRSDFLVSYLPYKVPTTGTHHEIIDASKRRKPTLLVCTQGKKFLPLWYRGFIKREFLFGSWDDLWGYLRKVDMGHVTESRWDFVCGRL